MTFLYPQFFILFLVLFWLYNRRYKMLYISLALVILSLTRPVLTEQKIDAKIDAKDIVIALDVSYSMRADDIKPTRLQRAKESIEKILKENKKDRFSLFAFTINPLILSPSTTDHRLLISALYSLKEQNILSHGTDFETLFSRISKIKTPIKNVLLFSDGGDLKDIDVPKDLRIFAVSCATKKGAKLKDDYGKNIKDEHGNLVISRLNPNLKKLAEMSGGSFVSLDEVDSSLSFIDKDFESKKEKVGYVELFWIPLFVASVLFLLFFIKVPKKVLAIVPFLALSSEAGLLDWYYVSKANDSYSKGLYKEASKNFEKIEHKTMQSQVNLANSYYQAGSYKNAKAIYLALSSTNPELKKLIFYKLGNCFVKLEEYDRARSYYLKALSFGDDEDVEYNLKLIESKKQKQRRDFAAIKSEDKEKKNSPKGSKKQKPNKSGGKSNSKTGMGSKGAGVSSKNKSSSKAQQSKLTRPIGFKAYELINRGYIDEKTPW